jgi:hypothetical protein
MADDVTIEGLQELTRLFREMETNSGRRIVKAALRAAVNEIAKEMRRELSPKVKEARKAIRHIVKGSKRVTAKVGVHVGRGRSKQPKNNAPSRVGRGVGIGAPNVHWWIKGTDPRYRGQKRRASPGVARPGARIQPTGVMPAQQAGLASLAFRRAAGKLPALMQARADKQLQKEIARKGR